MKKLILLFAFAQLAASAVASTGPCYSIGDSDARSYCLAKASRDATHCYNIKSVDLRSMCLAEVANAKSH